jgi:hypothetical protein
MNRIQKMAWFLVISIPTAALLSLIALAVLYVKVGLPKAFAASGFLGIAGVVGLSTMLFGKDKGKVRCDERGNLISRQATMAGFAAAYLITGLICMLLSFILGSDATISVIWLPMIFMSAGLASFFVHSIAILVQYGWKGKENE